MTLYSIKFYWRDTAGSLQAILVSAPNKTEAVKRARMFVATQYPEPVVLDSAVSICKTNDDVLEWV